MEVRSGLLGGGQNEALRPTLDVENQSHNPHRLGEHARYTYGGSRADAGAAAATSGPIVPGFPGLRSKDLSAVQPH